MTTVRMGQYSGIEVASRDATHLSFFTSPATGVLVAWVDGAGYRSRHPVYLRSCRAKFLQTTKHVHGAADVQVGSVFVVA